MSKILTIGNQEFEIPESGGASGWGSEVTDFLEAVAEALETVQQPNDVPLATATINNNQVAPSNIPGFSFTTAEVQAINSEFFITRSTTSPVSKVTESGIIRGHYDGTNWYITVQSEQDSGVRFSITPAGQIQYTSTNLVGSGYVGIIRFRAKVINE